MKCTLLPQGLTMPACAAQATPAPIVTRTVRAKPAPAKPKPVHTPAATPTPAAALSTVKIDSGVDQATRAAEPSAINTSADGNDALTGITWSSWTAHSAEGSGSINVNSCQPNCAQGAAVNVRVSIALSAPVNGIFSAMTVTDHAGNTNTYSPNGGSDTYGLSTADKAPAASDPGYLNPVTLAKAIEGSAPPCCTVHTTCADDGNPDQFHLLNHRVRERHLVRADVGYF